MKPKLTKELRERVADWLEERDDLPDNVRLGLRQNYYLDQADKLISLIVKEILKVLPEEIDSSPDWVGDIETAYEMSGFINGFNDALHQVKENIEELLK